MTSPPSRPIAAAALLLAVLPGLCAAGARVEDAGAAKPVKLAPALQAKLGLQVRPLAARTGAATTAGFAKVLDPGPLAQLDSDIAAAAAAAEASAAEAGRSAALNADGQAVSAKQLEAARAQARADASRLALLRRRVGLEWGEGIARLSAGRRGALLAELAAGQAALVRIDAADGRGLGGLRTVEIDLGALGSVRATVLGAARSADVRLLSPGLLALARGPNARALSSGLVVPVTLAASAAAPGVLVPRPALLRAQGKTWVYVRTAPDSFVRKPVQGGLAGPDGLFAAQGLSPGEPVVVRGAGALFAAETNAGGEGGD